MAVDMQVSKLNPCLFVSKRVTVVAFVHNILFWSTYVAYRNELAMKWQVQGLLLEQEDDAAGYLGIQMS